MTDLKEKLYLLTEEIKDCTKEVSKCSYKLQKKMSSPKATLLDRRNAAEDLDGALGDLKRLSEQLRACIVDADQQYTNLGC